MMGLRRSLIWATLVLKPAAGMRTSMVWPARYRSFAPSDLRTSRVRGGAAAASWISTDTARRAELELGALGRIGRRLTNESSGSR